MGVPFSLPQFAKRVVIKPVLLIPSYSNKEGGVDTHTCTHTHVHTHTLWPDLICISHPILLSALAHPRHCAHTWGQLSSSPTRKCSLVSPHPAQAGSWGETFHFPSLSGVASESLSVWATDGLEGRP